MYKKCRALLYYYIFENYSKYLRESEKSKNPSSLSSTIDKKKEFKEETQYLLYKNVPYM